MTQAQRMMVGRAIWSLASLGIAWVLSGCATALRNANSLEQVRFNGLTNVTAFSAGPELCLRLAVPGRDVFAHARWPADEPAGASNRFWVAPLVLETGQEARRRGLLKEGAMLPIQEQRIWQRLWRKTLDGLTPAAPGSGVAVVVQNLEAILYRTDGGGVELGALESKPAGVRVERTLTNGELGEAIVRALEASASTPARSGRRYLFATGQEPPFVLIDLSARTTVFLYHLANPELVGAALSPGFGLRALNWIVVRNSLLTTLKNPVTTINRGLFRVGHTGATFLPNALLPARGARASAADGGGLAGGDWERELDVICSTPIQYGRLRFLIDGERFFSELIQSIQEARQAVDVQMYIFDTDDYAVRLADVLRTRSRSVRVRVLYDEFGSLASALSPPRSPMPPEFKPPADIERYLERGSRVAVRAAPNPWFTSNHKKVIALDARKAYVGGMNFGREYRYEWHDMMVELTGPVVGELQHGFDCDWAHAGLLGDCAFAWCSLLESHPHRNRRPGDIPIRLLHTKTGRPEIYEAHLRALRRAQTRVFVENAYFTDDTLLGELIAARRRGVDVRAIVPAENDSGVMNAGNLAKANALLKEGVRVFVYPGMLHLKAALIDGWACTGSANLNRLSMFYNQELNVAFSDPSTVAVFERDLFEADFAKSRELTAPLPTSWTDYLLELVSNHF
jgi:cardiolipin synthase